MKKVKGNILVVDDDPDILHTARVVLKQKFEKVLTEGNPQQIPYLLNNHHFDVVLLDMNFTAGATSGKEGLHWLREIISIKPGANVIMITAYGQINLAVEAMKQGAIDFVVKPWENEKLQATVYSAYNLSESKQEVERLKSSQAKLKQVITDQPVEIIGKSTAMEEVFSAIDKVAETDANILVLGENGTGKEVIARAIHNQSLRKEEAFIKIDLGAVPESLFESELFGHMKGAFTDAKNDRAGRFEVASGGTLFLDEIGNLSLSMQSKLLTVLQNREVIRIGSNKPIPIDIRLICATNIPLHELVAEKKFREDLLYRFNTVEIRLPSLSERIEDIPILLEHFLKMYSQKYRKSGLTISREAIKQLQKYKWPGNIRELQHATERAVIMGEDTVLQKNDYILSYVQTATPMAEPINLDEMEKKAIAEAIKKHKGNMSKAAKELGLGRTTLYRKIEKYDL